LICPRGDGSTGRCGGVRIRGSVGVVGRTGLLAGVSVRGTLGGLGVANRWGEFSLASRPNDDRGRMRHRGMVRTGGMEQDVRSLRVRSAESLRGRKR
jgi:hypothetical protein